MITITKHKVRCLGYDKFRYAHSIQFPHSEHNYYCEMTDEGMMYLIEHLKKSETVEFKEI